MTSLRLAPGCGVGPAGLPCFAGAVVGSSHRLPLGSGVSFAPLCCLPVSAVRVCSRPQTPRPLLVPYGGNGQIKWSHPNPTAVASAAGGAGPTTHLRRGRIHTPRLCLATPISRAINAWRPLPPPLSKPHTHARRPTHKRAHSKFRTPDSEKAFPTCALRFCLRAPYV